MSLPWMHMEAEHFMSDPMEVAARDVAASREKFMAIAREVVKAMSGEIDSELFYPKVLNFIRNGIELLGNAEQHMHLCREEHDAFEAEIQRLKEVLPVHVHSTTNRTSKPISSLLEKRSRT